MINIHSLDGDRIIVTHYCAAGSAHDANRAVGAANGKYDFTFVRVSGTKTQDEGHMSALALSIPDQDHLTQTWTFDDHGKSMVNTFTYTRAK